MGFELTIGNQPRGIVTGAFIEGGALGHFGLSGGLSEAGWFVKVKVGIGAGFAIGGLTGVELSGD